MNGLLLITERNRKRKEKRENVSPLMKKGVCGDSTPPRQDTPKLSCNE
jgi:hypothetical protein